MLELVCVKLSSRLSYRGHGKQKGNYNTITQNSVSPMVLVLYLQKRAIDDE